MTKSVLNPQIVKYMACALFIAKVLPLWINDCDWMDFYVG